MNSKSPIVSHKSLTKKSNISIITCLKLLFCGLILLGITNTAQALSITLDGTRTVLSGTDCGSAPTTYRFGTTASWQGTPLDIIVSVNAEDNDYVLGATTGGGSCVYASGGVLSVNLRDKDASDNVAFIDATITIVVQGTTTPVFIDRINATGFDLDHNGLLAPNTSSTDTDDIYLSGPGASYLSSSTNVTYSTGSFPGGHDVKFRGQTSTFGNCADTPTTPVISCRAAATWTGGTGSNSISSINARFQNDNAYGLYSTASNNAYRLLQLSFQDSHAEQILAPNTDFGDAPASYGSARHIAITLQTLLGNGLGPDHETANQPSVDALGDDNDASAGNPFYDDEDAVRRNGALLDGQHVVASENVSIDVTTFGTGYLSAWMDLNIDGDFADASEKLLSDVFINSTTVQNTALVLPVPYTATGGNTYLRFRFSGSTGVGYSGSISGGEVEDYRIIVDPMSPSYNMVKTSNGPITAAGLLTYTFTFENTGNVELSNLNVTDPDIDSGTLTGCPVVTLAVGASQSCTATRTITQAQVDTGTDISNTATVSAVDPATDPVTEDDTSDNTVVTTITQSPSYTMAKSSDTATISAPGTITYTFDFVNTGNVELTNLTVNDANIDSGTLSGCPISSLSVGASVSCTATRAIDQAQIDAGVDITNTATSSATGPDGTTPITEDDTANDNSTSTSVTQTPSYTMAKSSDTATISAPGIITYTFDFVNTGNVTLNNLTITDANIDGGTLSDCPIATLAVGGTANCTATRAISQSQIDAGTALTNNATSSAEHAVGDGTVSVAEDNTANDNSTSTSVIQNTSLTIAKIQTGGANPVLVPSTIDYTIVVTNDGNVSLTSVVASDVLPDGSAGTLSAATESGTADGILSVGETFTYTISYDVTQADINAGADLVNTASVVTTEVAGPTEDTATTTITRTPSLTVVKDVDQAGITVPGTLNYTITVSNTGNVDITNVVLTDDLAGSANLDSGDTANAGVLDVGETWIYSATYAATQADINAGADLVNTASVVTTEVAGPTEDTATTTITRTPSLTVVKDVDQAGITVPGTLNYTITVSNTGNVDITNVVLTDDLAGSANLDSGDTANAGVLDVGETWIYSATYAATQADINAGADLVNTASVVTTEVAGPTEDTATTTITRTPSLTVVKDVDQAGITVPGTLNYTITVSNTGNVDITNVVLTDDLAGSANLDSGDTANAGVLDVGETWIYSATYAATQADINAGADLVNTASVVTTEVAGPTEDTATTTITRTPSLTVVKDVDQAGITVPGTLNYTITVSNTGNVDITNVVLTDDLAGSANLDSGDTANAGVLDVGETWIYSATYAATQADINAGADLVNTASVVTTEVAGPTEDTATTTITRTPSLTVVKDVDQAGITVPGTLNYTITVSNTGNVDITNVVLTDDLAGSANLDSGDTANAGVLDVGETWIYSATYAATQADINAGADLVNTASVVTTEVAGPTEDTATTTITRTPSLTVVKDVDQAGITVPGTLNYTITVSNTGNVDITNVVLTDDLAGSANLDSGDTANAGVLDVGETWIYSATYAATQADINAGADLVNTASVVTTEVAGPTEDTATTTITRTPSLTVVKDVDQAGITVPGTLNYTITVSNTGNVDITNVVLTDDLAGSANLDSGDTANAGVLDVGETWIYSATYAATQADINAGADLVNTASVVTTEVAGPTEDTATTTITRTPSLTVVKDVDQAGITVPGTLNYTITVSNTGNVDITNVVLTDDLAGSANLDSGDTANAGVLDVGETWIYSATYAATQADINAGADLVNTASVVTTEVAGPTEDTATTTITRTPSLTVVKDVDQAGITVPGTLNYTITVSNTGNVDITNVVLTDDLAGSANLDSGDTANAGVLDVGETWIYSATYAATQADINAGADLVNTASVVTTEVAGPTEDTATTTITRTPSLTVVKDVDQAGITVPGTLNYTITVSNTGNVDITNVVLTDDLAGSANLDSGDTANAGVLDVGETWIYSATYAATQADINAGADLVNTASVVTTEVAGPTEDTATTTITRTPSLTVVKDVDQAGITVPGTLNYTITVSNTGNVDITNVVLTDDLAGSANLDSGDTANAGVLDVGETWIYSATYAATQADINAGADLVNTASVVTTEVAGPTEDTATTTITRTPSLTIVKSAQTIVPANFIVNATVTYDYVVTNTGNITITIPITVTDNLIPNLNPADVITCDTWPVAGLAPGNTYNCTGTYTVTSNDVAIGSVTNLASASDGTITSPTDSETVPSGATPALTVVKTSVDTSYASVGETLNYTYVVENTGNAAFVEDILVTDDKIGTLVCWTATASDPDFIPAEKTTCSTDITNAYTVTQADIEAGSVTNNAYSSTIYALSTNVYSTEVDLTIYATQLPSWTVVKATSDTPTAVGNTLNYTFTVNNTGNVSISNVSVSDPKCATMPTLTSGDSDSDNVLDVNESHVYSCTSIAVTQIEVDSGKVDNTVTVTGTPTGGVLPVASDSLSTPIIQSPSLSIVKSAATFKTDADGSTDVTLGDTLEYTVTAANDGNVTLTNVVVFDPQLTPNSFSCSTLAPAATCVLTGDHVVTFTEADVGEVVNTAGVVSFEITTSVTSNTVTTPVENIAPVANNDSQNNTGVPSPTNPTTLATVGANDTDADGTIDPATVDLDPATAGIQSSFTNADGTYTVDAAGNVTFTPDAALTGNPTAITYTVNDNAGNTSNAATLTVTYGVAPVAVDDSQNNTGVPSPTNPTTLATVGANDTDADGTIDPATVDLDPATAGIQSSFTNADGTYTVDAAGNVTFTPDAALTGNPTAITYTVNDNAGNTSNAATLTVTYGVAPVAVDDSQNNTGVPSPTNPTTLATVGANDTDADGTIDPATVDLDPATAGIQSSFTNADGTYTVDAAGNVTFTPDAALTGNPTAITYTVNDNAGNTSNAATLTVTYGVAPVAVDDSQNNTGVPSPTNPTTLATVGANDTDADGTIDPATVDLDPATAGIQSSFTNADGTYTVDAAGNVTFTPDAALTGNPTAITYTVNDNAGNTSNAATLTVTYGVAPVAVDDSQNNTGVPSPTNPTTLATVGANDTDADGTIDPATVDLDPATAGIQSSFTNADGTYTVDAAGNVTFTPDAALTGNPTAITYTVNDNAGNTSNAATLTVTYGVAPVAVDDSQNNTGVPSPTNPTTLATVGANDTDADGTIDPATVDLDPATAGIQSSFTNADGTYTVDAAGNVTFTPDVALTGNPAAITYTVNDNDGNTSNSATLTVTYGVAPVAVDDSQNNTGVPSPTNPTTLATVGSNDTDADGTINPATVDLNPAVAGIQNTFTNADGTWTVDASGNVTFTPDAALTGNPTAITYTVNDNAGNTSNAATLTVTYGVAPVAVDDSQNNTGVPSPTNPTTLATVGANDTDADGTIDPATVDLDPATAGIQSSFTNADGTYTVDAAGNVTFTPDAALTGNPTAITYTVNDNAGNPAAITYTVNDNDGNTSNSATLHRDLWNGTSG